MHPTPSIRRSSVLAGALGLSLLFAVALSCATDVPAPTTTTCSSNSDCPAPQACVEGTCDEAASCSQSELDCSNSDDDDCDGLVDCADPECADLECNVNPCGTLGTCRDGVCDQAPAAPGTVCRPVSGICDVEELCGGGLDCPPESFLPEGTACGTCNACDGLGGCLPLLDGTTCGAGRSCLNGACVTCGGVDQPCCNGTTCSGTGVTCEEGVCLAATPTPDAGMPPDAGPRPDAGTPPGPVVKKTVVMAADIVQASFAARAKRVAALITAHSPKVEFITAGGDNARYGTSSGLSLLEYYEKYWGPATSGNWGQFNSILFPVPGNHEYNAPDAHGYFVYFKNRLATIDARAGTHGYPGVEGKGYYSFDINGWHFVGLNSNCGQVGGCGATSPQYTWLKNDLAAHRHMPIIGYFHHPPFICGSSPFQTNATTRPLWNALWDAGADFLFTGHSHFYQRFKPLSRDLTTIVPAANGVTAFVVGNSGVDTQGNCPNPPARLAKQAGGDAGVGAFFLTLGNDGSYSFQYKKLDGTVFDSGSGWSRHRP